MQDDAVLQRFSLTQDDLLGHGGESRVYVLLAVLLAGEEERPHAVRLVRREPEGTPLAFGAVQPFQPVAMWVAVS